MPLSLVIFTIIFCYFHPQFLIANNTTHTKLCPLYCALKKTFETWHRIIHAEGSTQFTCNQDNILTAQ